jgi:hypothetical protein
MTQDLIAHPVGSALAGGALIGLSATGFLMFIGRLAGISGLLGGLLPPNRSDWPWRLGFLVGLSCAPLAWLLVAELPAVQVQANPGVLLLAGLLVGWGTRHGLGCTSGHTVCGLARGSKRSLVASASFLGSAFLTVFVWRHLFVF